MTGFARAQGRLEVSQEGASGESPGASWIWEVRSVNGRGLDVRMRLPQGFESLDGPARAAVARHVVRGNVSLTLQVEAARDGTACVVNQVLLESLATLATDLARRHPDLAPARIDGLMGLRGVLDLANTEVATGPEAEAARARRDEALLAGLEQAMDGLSAARRAEGARLADVLTGILDQIDTLRARAGALAATQPEALRERLRQQVAALLDVTPMPSEERLHQEAAILAVKADVREELDRLSAHIGAARDLLATEGVVGRRLDFLCQEFNREANTLCSKSTDSDLTALGLALKAAIDQLREHVQNIE
nr:YicC/YloC family endoribonuclease [Roseospira visakhapatnamensis]